MAVFGTLWREFQRVPWDQETISNPRLPSPEVSRGFQVQRVTGTLCGKQRVPLGPGALSDPPLWICSWIKTCTTCALGTCTYWNNWKFLYVQKTFSFWTLHYSFPLHFPPFFMNQIAFLQLHNKFFFCTLQLGQDYFASPVKTVEVFYCKRLPSFVRRWEREAAKKKLFS